MHLPRCCEKAAAATGARLRLLRSTGSEEESLNLKAQMTRGPGPSSTSLTPPISRQPSARLAGRAIPSAASQEPQQQTSSSSSSSSSSNKAAATAPALVRRRSGGATLSRQHSTTAAAAAAATATASARQASSSSVSTDASRKGEGERSVSAEENLAEAFAFPETSDPVEHVAKTYPGGPSAFVADMGSREGPPRALWLLLLLVFLAAAAASFFRMQQNPQDLVGQHVQEQQQQQQQHMQQLLPGETQLGGTPQEPAEAATKVAAATATKAAAAAAAEAEAASKANKGSVSAAEGDRFPEGAPLPGVPLQKQRTAEGQWQLPAAAAVADLVLNVVQQGAPMGAPPSEPLHLWSLRRPRCGKETLVGGFVAVDTPQGTPIIRLPRALLLSSADAPPAVRQRCLLPQNNLKQRQQEKQRQQQTYRQCDAEELLAVLLLRELLLLRQLQQQNPAAAAAAAAGCLLNTTKRNAPYFGPYLWKALSLVLPLQGGQQLLLQQQLLQLSQGALSDFIGGATKGDIQKAVSLVHARSVWDGEGNVAVSALDELQEYHWNADFATQHETSPEGLLWRAPRDMPRGEKLYVNYGQYSNVYLLFHFGLETADNPWGPAFFWRTEAGDMPHAALPRGVSSFPILRSSTHDASLLPAWLRETKVLPLDEPCHPPLGDAPCPPPQQRQQQQEPEADRVSASEALTPDGRPGLVCNMRVFNLRAFGRGSFVLSLFGGVGGVDATVYKCVRALRFGRVRSALDREEKASGLFATACKTHHAQLTQAGHLLKAGISAKEAELPMLQHHRDTEQMEDAQTEIERLQAMSRAVQTNKEFTERCMRYFTQTLEALRQKRQAMASAAASR